jgi:hypothetical protein
MDSDTYTHPHPSPHTHTPHTSQHTQLTQHTLITQPELAQLKVSLHNQDPNHRTCDHQANIKNAGISTDAEADDGGKASNMEDGDDNMEDGGKATSSASPEAGSSKCEDWGKRGGDWGGCWLGGGHSSWFHPVGLLEGSHNAGQYCWVLVRFPTWEFSFKHATRISVVVNPHCWLAFGKSGNPQVVDSTRHSCLRHMCRWGLIAGCWGVGAL